MGDAGVIGLGCRPEIVFPELGIAKVIIGGGVIGRLLYGCLVLLDRLFELLLLIIAVAAANQGVAGLRRGVAGLRRGREGCDHCNGQQEGQVPGAGVA